MSVEREKVIDCGEAVMFLIVCKDEVLLQERSHREHGFAGETIIPGGKNGEGEPHGAAVKREVFEETGLENAKMILLGNEFKAITTSAHLYLMKAFMIPIDEKSEVKIIESEEGKFVWRKFSEAKSSIKWAHSQLVFERAEKLLMEEKLMD